MEQRIKIRESRYQAWITLVRRSLDMREQVKIMLEDNSMVQGIVIECSARKKVMVHNSDFRYPREIPWVVLVESENSWVELEYSNILYFTTQQIH
ncbi:MAG: hypothetical protein AB7S48_01245 [Bacteroidales bacterium]